MIFFPQRTAILSKLGSGIRTPHPRFGCLALTIGKLAKLTPEKLTEIVNFLNRVKMGEYSEFIREPDHIRVKLPKLSILKIIDFGKVTSPMVNFCYKGDGYYNFTHLELWLAAIKKGS